MRYILAVVVAGLVTAPAAGQWYARGDFNGWSTDNPMTNVSGNHWVAEITGLFDNISYEWKVADAVWTGGTIHPAGGNSKVYSDVNGEIVFHLYDSTSWDDGWFPNNTRRIGYDDPNQFGWEIVGSFNGFSGTHDPNYYLTDMGNGLYRGTFTLDTGLYDFKFRGVEANPLNAWDISIGNDFSNSAGNNTFAVTGDNQDWTFELDLPNGRFRYFTESAPALMGDHNGDGHVNAADYVLWRKDPGSYGGTQGYTDWRTNFGASGGGGPLNWLVRSIELGDEVLGPVGEGTYTHQETGLTPGNDYQFQIARSDLGVQVPGSHMKVRADANGEINLNFYELVGESWGDGWSPTNTHRVGYEDHNEFDWELIGSFNGWPGGADPNYFLTDQGNGLHTGSFFFDTGAWEFKFRQQGDWNTSIGPDFGNSAGNNVLNVASNGELWHFELDLPNGRWRAYMDVAALGSGSAVPEPASIALVMLGAFLALSVRRR